MDIMNPPSPKRLTNDERDRAVRLLSAAMSQGQIDTSEFDERSRRCYSATFREDLHPLFEDLVDDPHQTLFNPQRVAYTDKSTDFIPADQYPTKKRRVAAAMGRAQHAITGEPGSASVSFCIFGGVNRTSWVVPPSHTSIAVFGGIDLDLRRSHFEAPVTTIYANAIFGGTDIYIPEGFRVIVDGVGIFGGYEISIDDDAIGPGELPSDAPEIHIKGVALFGGVEVHIDESHDD